MNKTILIAVFLVAALLSTAEDYSKTDAKEVLDAAQYSIQQMVSAGFKAKEINKTLQEAEEAYRNRYYGQVIQLSSRIDSTSREAFSTYALISDAREEINANSAAGFDVKYAFDLTDLAEREFEKENYGEATRLINEALIANEAALPIMRKTISNKIQKNKQKIILFIIVTAVGLWLGTPILKRKLLSNKIKNLIKERESIKKQINEIEEKRFIQKALGEKDYNETRKEFERRIEEIKETITVLKRKKKTK